MDEPSTTPRPIRGTGRTARWIGIAIVLALVIGGLLYWRTIHEVGQPVPAGSPTAGAAPLPVEETLALPDSEPVDVQAAKATRRDLVYTITLPANISPFYQTTLYAKVSGYLKWIGPDKGDRVSKNQVVAIIDAPEVEEQYQQAVSDFKIKKLTYERLAKVWNESPDVIAKQDVDVAEATYQGARHLMEQRVIMRDYTKVRAPYGGIVTARFADPGALIQIATSFGHHGTPAVHDHGPRHRPRLCQRAARRQPLDCSRQDQSLGRGHGIASAIFYRHHHPLDACA